MQATEAKVIDSMTLNYFEVVRNSNKVWKGSVLSDGTFLAQWGRVRDGAKLQAKSKNFGSVERARTELFDKVREKMDKGYQVTQTVGENDTLNCVPVDRHNLKTIATTQIRGCDDQTTKELIEYLTKVNIHQILATTTIRFEAKSGSFRTPLGYLTPQAVSTAHSLLRQISSLNSNPTTRQRINLINDYFRLVPQDFGTRIPSVSQLIASDAEIAKQEAILDAIDAALIVPTPTEPVFECQLTKVPATTSEGKTTFRQIRELFHSTRNSHHSSSKYDVRRVFQVDIPSMRSLFEKTAQRIGHVQRHWHGTSTANLLSILKSGLIIPKSAANGRMFGNGIYGSLQSTKALNYSMGYWSGAKAERTFALLVDFALGKTFHPSTYHHSFPVTGYDSTFVQAGSANVLNQESIVYSVNQVNICYLVELGD